MKNLKKDITNVKDKQYSINKNSVFICSFCNAVVDVAHKVLLQNIAFKIFDGIYKLFIWISIINALIIIPFFTSIYC